MMGSGVRIRDERGELDKEDTEYVGIGFNTLAIVIVHRHRRSMSVTVLTYVHHLKDQGGTGSDPEMEEISAIDF
jgi:hypothetical protein